MVTKLMRLTFFTLIFLTFFSAHSALGPLVPVSEIPESVCKIDFMRSDHSTYHCSGILLDQVHVKTAAHCLLSDIKKIEVQCGNQSSLVTEKIASSDFSFEDIKSDINARRFDHAILLLDQKIDIPSLPFITDKDEISEVIKESDECAFFGVGLNPWLNGTGHIHGVKAKAKKISFDRETLILNAPYQAVSMIGDSGASFLCRKQGFSWKNIGTVSAHGWDNETIIAPNNYAPLIETSPDYVTVSEKKTIDSPNIKLNLKYWVKPFSTYKYKEEVYNTVDKVLVKFIPRRILGNKVLGQLILESSSQYYLCFDQNQCFTGTLEDVELDKSSLSLTKQTPSEFR